MDGIKMPEQLVFGLDIGTRSIVGTVGFKENQKKFCVLAQVVKMHETRAMLDGQIHDIGQVANTIAIIKNELQEKIGRELKDVCIAAAGRVLKTVTVKVEYDLEEETKISEEHIHSLELLGVEEAYNVMREEVKDNTLKLHCVGYSVIHYYLNDYIISNLEGHKGRKIAAEVLATFLPTEVLDGLYASVEQAGLYVSNLTLEPIAAIQVAIPVKFRLLNLALVDVGAGTSDISITKDGSIVGYGMIPSAGDSFTEEIAKRYLVDFQTAEKIKIACLKKKMVSYKDIMGISHKIETKEIIENLNDTIEKMTKTIAKKICQLNGGNSVSAVFIVGGGGKIHGFDEKLAQYLNLSNDRVAIRGGEVFGEVEFLQDEIKKDSLLVTPIGICLNYYEQSNNFIFVSVNNQRVKLYNNNKLTIMDAALQVGFPNKSLFPKRGKEIEFVVNGSKRVIRGQLGEAAMIYLNGKKTSINEPISRNDIIEIVPSTKGLDAVYEIRKLPEFYGTIAFYFNEKKITCPKFVEVNGEVVTEYYQVKEKDEITILNYYTLKQILDFMDISYEGKWFVNNKSVELNEKIYENFSVVSKKEEAFSEDENINDIQVAKERENEEIIKESKEGTVEGIQSICITVNQQSVILSGKERYILVDILDFYPFDTSVARGKTVVITLNGEGADFTTSIKEKDIVEIYWK